MLRKLGVWGAALTMAAAPVLANEHVVMVYSDGFFPTTSYVQPGDTVRFINLSEVEESVFSLNMVPTEDPDDGDAEVEVWAIGPIAIEDEVVVEVTVDAEGDYQLASSVEAVGALSFAPPPINTDDADIDDQVSE